MYPWEKSELDDKVARLEVEKIQLEVDRLKAELNIMNAKADAIRSGKYQETNCINVCQQLIDRLSGSPLRESKFKVCYPDKEPRCMVEAF